MEPSFYISGIIFLFTVILIITEKVHRTVIGLFGAVLMIVAGMAFHFYSPDLAIEAIDFNTIGLLLGMMIVVAVLEKTGFFQYLAIFTAKKTNGDPWKLLIFLGAITTIFSMILDNVTTVILIAPVTIIIVRILKINPVPILMAEAILSNIGGTATLIGDPPNIMIGSAANISFNEFLFNIGPVVIFAWFLILFVFRFIFKKEMSQKVSEEDIDDLIKMNEKEVIKDKKNLKIILAILGFTIILFFFHGLLEIPPSIVALIGAVLTLILVHPKTDPQPILEKIEWSVLLFFVSLFIIVGGLEQAGVLEVLASQIGNFAGGNIVLTAIILMWASAIISAVVDNIPFTVAMIPIVLYLETKGVNVTLLWWALAIGVGFGGNGTPIGATANIVVVAKSEQTGHPITFKNWIKSGATVTFFALIIASIYIAVFAKLLIN